MWTFSGNRLNVYLTNTLAEPAPLSSWIPDFISIESSNANICKTRYTVFGHNWKPPYLAASANENRTKSVCAPNLWRWCRQFSRVEWCRSCRKKRWINDDYVKFMRYCTNFTCQKWFYDQSLALITNHGFSVNNPTFHRKSWMHSFQRIFDL